MLGSVRLLLDMGYKLYGSMGTADFYNEHGLKVETIDWLFGNIGDNPVFYKFNFQTVARSWLLLKNTLVILQEHVDLSCEMLSMSNFLSNRMFDLVINLPMRIGGVRRVSSFGLPTNGYRARRMAIDFSVPLITDIKCAKLIIVAIYRSVSVFMLNPSLWNRKIVCFLVSMKQVSF